jgi:hypothetical protein
VRKHVKDSNTEEVPETDMPMFDDSPHQQCARKGCRYFGTWRPVLLLRPSRTYTGKPIEAVIGLLVCGDHREASAEKFLTTEMWESLVEWCTQQGKAAPHRPSTRLEYRKPEGSSEAGLKFDRLH